MSSLSLRLSSLRNRKGLGLARLVMCWIETRRTRIALSHLDTRLLDDVGLTQQSAWNEAHRPFWS